MDKAQAMVAGPVAPKLVSGLWGCQWDLAKATQRQATNDGVPLPPSRCFLWYVFTKASTKTWSAGSHVLSAAE